MSADEERFGRVPSLACTMMGGVQYLFFFVNGRGASVIRHRGSYGGKRGLWELAVLLINPRGWELDYTTGITDDVLGNLEEPEVVELLDRIRALPDAPL